jgi:hypothetical protein
MLAERFAITSFASGVSSALRPYLLFKNQWALGFGRASSRGELADVLFEWFKSQNTANDAGFDAEQHAAKTSLWNMRC